MPWIIDAHQDMAYNMLTHGRDYRRSAAETRRLETGTVTIERTGQTLLGWEDYQLGQVAVIFATLFVAPTRHKGDEYETIHFTTNSENYQHLRKQVDLYNRLMDESPEKFRLVKTRKDLAEVLQAWDEGPSAPPERTHPTGLVLLMEGAEGLSRPEELEEWVAAGLRIVGPVWAGTRYCGGSRAGDRFTSEGLHLLEVMAGLNLTLDLSHMTEESALTALDRYEGQVIATHANALALLGPDMARRHFSDRVLRGLIERDGVVGVLPFNKFLVPDWSPTDPRERVTLQTVVAHIDHICQLAGSARHVAIGTDFDGGYGWPAVPAEINTIADLQKLAPLLAEKGYSDADITAILGKNWQRVLEMTLPA